ncbi:MAG: ABC transporter ATP-binding protein [Deltaproteobacteria bacterium]
MIPLELRGVSKRRGAGRRSVQVLAEVNLEVRAGEVVLLEGPSGSGKTTLLGVAGGLLTADSGVVILAGNALGSETQARRRAIRARCAGVVFQRANLLAGLTARENVILMSRLAGMTGREGAQEADRVLDLLGLAALAHRRPPELSGGEEQRVAVARALVHRPAVVLADEPTGNLDAASGHSVAASLSALARDRSSAVLICTHDQRLAPFATRRLSIVDGRVVPWGE